jgi:hypothetical protein
VTRFSLRDQRIMKMAGIRSEPMRREWFQLRSLLFNEITLPSIIAQSIQPTRWYLLLSDGDQSLLERYVSPLPDWVKPLYLQLGEAVKTQIYDDILASFGSAMNLVIGRLDNDDALHFDYFKTMNDELDWSDVTADRYLIQDRGCRWDGYKIQRFRYESSPFFTVASNNWQERQPNPLVDHRNVLHYKHCFLKGAANDSMWMQSVHGLNASNVFRADFGNVTNVDIEYIIQMFGVTDGAVRAIQLNTPPT